MANTFIDPAYGNSLNQKFRAKRFEFFLSLLARIRSDRPIRILDIGGTETYWDRMSSVENLDLRITLLNLEAFPTKRTNFTSVIGDACDLSAYQDNEFDVVFSNSVIEHLFTRENQQKMANEAMRVGKYYYIQTPNLYFPMEPHWMFPFFQFLPFRLRVFLTRNFDLGHYVKAANEEDAVTRVKEVQLLTERNMKDLFPDGLVYREMFLGLVKSITLYRFPEK